MTKKAEHFSREQRHGNCKKESKENTRNEKYTKEYFGGLISQLNTTEEGISKIEDKSIEVIVKKKK